MTSSGASIVTTAASTHPGAYVAYASAARLAQRLTYYGHDPLWFGQALDRYALAYGTLATHNGMLVPRWTMVQDLPAADVTPNEPQPALAPLPLPKVDVNGLDAAQRQLWMDARDRFRAASPAVHGARVLLDQLSERLRRQGLTLNPANRRHRAEDAERARRCFRASSRPGNSRPRSSPSAAQRPIGRSCGRLPVSSRVLLPANQPRQPGAGALTVVGILLCKGGA